jgi:hypothetical protein
LRIGLTTVVSPLQADELAEGLSGARALLLVNDAEPLPEGSCCTLLDNAPAMERVVLLSRMGVTRAKPPGPFGLGGGDDALLRVETEVRKQAAERGLELSVVRVGALKGGGPGIGGVAAAPKQEGDDEPPVIDMGLAKPYYDGIAEVRSPHAPLPASHAIASPATPGTPLRQQAALLVRHRSC